jgi:hypothetical protein
MVSLKGGFPEKTGEHGRRNTTADNCTGNGDDATGNNISRYIHMGARGISSIGSEREMVI